MFVAVLSEDICKTAIKKDELKKVIENEIHLIFEKRSNYSKPLEIAYACLGILEFIRRFAEGASNLPIKPSKLLMKQKKSFFLPVEAESLSVNQLCYILMSSVFSCQFLLDFLSSLEVSVLSLKFLDKLKIFFKLEDIGIGTEFTERCSDLVEKSAKLTHAFLGYLNVKDSAIPSAFWLSLNSSFKDDNMGKVREFSLLSIFLNKHHIFNILLKQTGYATIGC